MAHSARLNSLTDGLVTSVTGLTPRDNNFRACREQAVKGLRDQSHGRSNPFQVNDSLSGLVEKFSVVNREDVAEALQSRLDELPKNSQWLPEILALIIRLSKRPLETENLEAVDLIVSPPVEEILTWNDIFADRPQTDDGLWDDIERGYHSSGDERTVDGEHDSEPTTSTQATSFDGEDLATLARLYVIRPDSASLDAVRANASGRMRNLQKPSNLQQSETAAIRDSLTMLQGLPTTLYTIDSRSAAIRFSSSGTFTTMEVSTSRDVFEQLANIGSHLNYLRHWILSERSLAYLQSVQATIRNLLRHFSSSLSEIEQGYITPHDDKAASIIGVRFQVETLALPLIQLSTLLRRSFEDSRNPSPFPLLDLLYEESCIAHMHGDLVLFETLNAVLFAGFHTYLKPVQTWIEIGKLPTRDTETFFVKEAEGECERGDAWYERFELRRVNGAVLCAPAFMRDFVPVLFAMGKSRAFLKLLQRSDDSIENGTEPDSNALPDFKAITSRLSTNPLLPFSLLFREALENWMNRSGTDRVPALRTVLLQKYHSDTFFSSLRPIFFASDGSLFQEFTDHLFERIHNNPKIWKQDFMLTELAQSTIGMTPSVDKSGLSIRTRHETEHTVRSISRDLELLALTYQTSWPIQNITRSSSPASHSQAFVLSLQAYHAKYILRPELFTLRALDFGASRLPAQEDLTEDYSRHLKQLKWPINLALRLRSNLIWFIDIIQSHFNSTTTVLHRDLCADMEKWSDIDKMAASWAAYENKLQTRLLLAEKLSPIRTALTDVMELCERFAQFWRQHVAPLTSAKSDDHGPSDLGARVNREVTRLHIDFQRLLAFIVAGLRGVSRAGGEPGLEALAERLEQDQK